MTTQHLSTFASFFPPLCPIWVKFSKRARTLNSNFLDAKKNDYSKSAVTRHLHSQPSMLVDKFSFKLQPSLQNVEHSRKVGLGEWCFVFFVQGKYLKDRGQHIRRIIDYRIIEK